VTSVLAGLLRALARLSAKGMTDKGGAIFAPAGVAFVEGGGGGSLSRLRLGVARLFYSFYFDRLELLP
jgi:hypothetical protein